MSVGFWDPSPAYEQFETVDQWSQWDTGFIDYSMIMPGLVRVRSRKHRKLLSAQGVGAQRTELRDTGAEASMIEITCQMWMPKHLEQFAALAEYIELKGGTRGDPRSLRVIHPGLALLKINHLYITSIGVPERHGDGGSFYVATIEAQEWKPPRKDAKNGKTYDVDPKAKEPPSAIEPKVGGLPSKTGSAP